MLSKFGIQKFFIRGHVEGEKLSLPTGVLNFALITKLPHHHLPSLFHVHGVAVSPPARPRAAPSPLSPSLVLPKPLGLSTRRHLPARTPRTAVDAPRRRKRRAVPCAASQLAVKPLPSPPPPQLSAQIASPSPRASPRPAHRLSLYAQRRHNTMAAAST